MAICPPNTSRTRLLPAFSSRRPQSCRRSPEKWLSTSLAHRRPAGSPFRAGTEPLRSESYVRSGSRTRESHRTTIGATCPTRTPSPLLRWPSGAGFLVTTPGRTEPAWTTRRERRQRTNVAPSRLAQRMVRAEPLAAVTADPLETTGWPTDSVAGLALSAGFGRWWTPAAFASS